MIYKKQTKNILKKITAFLINIFKTGASLIKENPCESILKQVSKSLEDGKYYITYRMMPKKGKLLSEHKVNMTDESDCAIVLQGPIRTEEDFTLETIKYYKRVSKATIILSTWDDLGQDTIKQCEEAGAIVVLNKKPSYSGILNVNYQLVSSYAGIKKAKECGASFICKSRTDQRICKANALSFMKSLLNDFPISQPCEQNKRIVLLSMNYGNVFHPFFVSDFLYYGYCDDMERLFSIKLDNRSQFELPEQCSKKKHAELMYAPEIFIFRNYLKSINIDNTCTVENYWEVLKKYFICVDRKTLDLFWPKYENHYSEHNYYGDYFENDSDSRLKTMNFDFVNWLCLYNNLFEYKEEYEKYAEAYFE